MADISALIDAERERLAAALDALDAGRWQAPSLCGGWRVRDVVVHVLMPYEQTVPRFAVAMARARFRFDAMADRWATADRRSTPELVAALRVTAHRPFRVPGAGPDAALSHLVIHAEDVYRALGLDERPDEQSAVRVLDQLTTPRARRALRTGLLDGLAFSATDAGWSHGVGPTVRGTAAALIVTLAGRSAALTELSGDGAPTLRSRLAAGTSESVTEHDS